MALKGAGLKVLRWFLWLLLGWVLLRGVVSFLPEGSETPAAAAPAAEAKPVAEPAGLRSFPAMFAREYLTWQPGKADERATRLQPFLGRGLDAQAGWQQGKDSAGQVVEGAWVHDVQQVDEVRWLVTVAARVVPYLETNQVEPTGAAQLVRTNLPASTVYLAVPLTGLKQGGWVVSEFPALVPGPAAGEAPETKAPGQEVGDRDDRVKTLATGFFRAYLGGGGDVTYFLAPDTRLAPVRSQWSFDSVAKVTLYNTGTGYAAAVDVLLTDPQTGARFTNRYSLRLVEREGRWYIKDLLQKGE